MDSNNRLGIRKRVEDGAEESYESLSERRKRPRISAMELSMTFERPLEAGEATQIAMGIPPRLSRTSSASFFDDDSSIGSMSMNNTFLFSPARHAPSLSGNTSRSGSPYFSTRRSSYQTLPDRGLVRSVSSSSLRASFQTIQEYPENSAKYFLRHARSTFDYSLPDAPNEISACLLSCTINNLAVFTRGNRIHYKNINTNDNTDIAQLCKLAETKGHIRTLRCGGKSQGDLVAIGTSKGYIQIWDVVAKKATTSWPTTKEISALAWNGPILSVGGITGTIRHYDTRVPAAKMKEHTRKVTRHQGQITCLEWNETGAFLASGDATGVVHCWELGQKAPLEVGEFISRRKKIQHKDKVAAVAWAPWQPSLLATGDIKGNVRLWNVGANPNTGSNTVTPGKLTLRSVLTGMHFSPHCKEILTAHGDLVTQTTVEEQYNDPKPHTEDAIVVHAVPTLRHVKTFNLTGARLDAIGDSVLDGSGTKVIFSTPKHGKIDICEVWKKKEVKKRMSFVDYPRAPIR